MPADLRVLELRKPVRGPKNVICRMVDKACGCMKKAFRRLTAKNKDELGSGSQDLDRRTKSVNEEANTRIPDDSFVQLRKVNSILNRWKRASFRVTIRRFHILHLSMSSVGKKMEMINQKMTSTFISNWMKAFKILGELLNPEKIDWKITLHLSQTLIWVSTK